GGVRGAVCAPPAAPAVPRLRVETMGSHSGGVPHGLPRPRWPVFAGADWRAILPAVLAFTLLGGIESLLSAKVADGMTRRRHRSNMELVAQGIANMATALFGGISATGTIARTPTHIRARATSPIAV